MTPRALIRTALLMAVVAVVGVVVMDRASAAEPVRLVGGGERIPSLIPKGGSVVYDLPRDIKNVLVGDPKIADAVILSSRRVEIISNNTGGTNIVFFDVQGARIAEFNILVAPDVGVIQTAIRKLIRGVNVEAIGDGILLTGTVSSQAEAQQACDIASHFLTGDSFGGGGGGGGGSGSQYNRNSSYNDQTGQYVSSTSSATGSGVGVSSCKVDKVVNAIVVGGREQVILKVTVAEMDRTVIKQLGINLSGSAGYGSAVVNFNSTNPFPVNGTPSSSISGGFKGLTATLQAMEQVGVVRTLAEPTLSAITGESAHFLVGGLFPYPIPAGVGSPPSIQFQQYGVALNFTPVVLSEGRISLHVGTEVSQLDPANSVTISGNHRSRPDRAARGHDGRSSLRWLARDGRHARGSDQTDHHRSSRTDGGAYSRHAVQEPRLPE